MGGKIRRFTASLVLGLLGCGKSKADDAGVPLPTPAELAKSFGLDASALASDPSDPIAPAGNLRDEAEHFTSLEACVAERAKVDPLLGDAIRAIGYDTLFYDGCRMLLATKDRDVRSCAPIVSSALRARCETLVSIARGDVESCPRTRETSVTRGRSPSCLAAASGDARLCQGETTIPRIHCEALVMRDEKRCDWLPDDVQRPGMGKRSCLRELARLRALLPEAKVALPPLVTPKAELWVTLDGRLKMDSDAGVEARTDDASASEVHVDATAEIAQGVVIFPAYARREVFDRTRLGVEIGAVSDLDPVFVAASPTRGARLSLFVSIAKGGKDARVERAELDMPNARAHVYPGERFKSTVTFGKVDDVRGAEVSLSLEGELDQARIKVKLEVTTFVRDVVTTVPGNLPSPLLAISPDRDSGLLPLERSPWLSRDAGAIRHDGGP